MVKVVNDPWDCMDQSFQIICSSFFAGHHHVCVGGWGWGGSSCCRYASRFEDRDKDKVAFAVFIINPKVSLITAQSTSPMATFFRLTESFSSPTMVG